MPAKKQGKKKAVAVAAPSARVVGFFQSAPHIYPSTKVAVVEADAVEEQVDAYRAAGARAVTVDGEVWHRTPGFDSHGLLAREEERLDEVDEVEVEDASINNAEAGIADAVAVLGELAEEDEWATTAAMTSEELA